MPAPRCHLRPLYPVTVDTLEAGDLFLAPGLPGLSELWWVIPGAGDERTLLLGTSRGEPACIPSRGSDPVLILHRDALGEPGSTERRRRFQAASNGVVWLHRTGHPAAPSLGAARYLLACCATEHRRSVPEQVRHTFAQADPARTAHPWPAWTGGAARPKGRGH